VVVRKTEASVLAVHLESSVASIEGGRVGHVGHKDGAVDDIGGTGMDGDVTAVLTAFEDGTTATSLQGDEWVDVNLVQQIDALKSLHGYVEAIHVELLIKGLVAGVIEDEVVEVVHRVPKVNILWKDGGVSSRKGQSVESCAVGIQICNLRVSSGNGNTSSQHTVCSLIHIIQDGSLFSKCRQYEVDPERRLCLISECVTLHDRHP